MKSSYLPEKKKDINMSVIIADDFNNFFTSIGTKTPTKTFFTDY